MKKLLILLLFSNFTNAQQKLATYENTYAEQTYDIRILSEDKFVIYMDALSVDALYDKGGIFIEEKKHQEFLNSLTEAKLKYDEWVKTAKENKIKELYKSMNIKSRAGGYFLCGNDWRLQRFVNLSFDFSISEKDEDIKYLLLVKTGTLRDGYVSADGFALVFSSSKEIEDFINAISVEKVKEFLSKPKTQDLFKN